MSLRAQFVMWNLRRTVRTQPIHEMDPVELREMAEKYTGLNKIPSPITVTQVDEGGVKGEWQRHTDSRDDYTIFYLHGGGYVFGSPRTHRAATFALAEKAQSRVFALDYRLAPEHPFPAAVDDALAAWRWLLGQGIDAQKTVIAGDSAGGGLTYALVYALKARGLPMPVATVTYSPWADLSVSGSSMDTNAKSDSMFKPEYIREGVKRVLNGRDPRAPLASPVFADVSGYPPTLIFVNDEEVLLDDSLRMHANFEEAGVPSTLVRKSGVPHAWPVFYGFFPEAREAIDETAEFIRGHLEAFEPKEQGDVAV